MGSTDMKRDSSIILLFVGIWVVLLGDAVPYALVGGVPSGLAWACSRVWVGLAVVLWVARDVHASRFDPWFEYPAFLFLAWPVILPHNLVRTRGWRGVYLSLAFYSPMVLLGSVYAVGRILLSGRS